MLYCLQQKRIKIKECNISIIPESEAQVNKVYDVQECDIKTIVAYLQGAVHCWCNNKPKYEWFSARDFVGRDNHNWEGTPLYALFEKHSKLKNKQDDMAIDHAGKDLGWLLKKVIKDDSRKFETEIREQIRKHRELK